MKLKAALLPCIACTLTACASQPQIISAQCPPLPSPPAILRRSLPTLDLLPVASDPNHGASLQNGAQ